MKVVVSEKAAAPVRDLRQMIADLGHHRAYAAETQHSIDEYERLRPGMLKGGRLNEVVDADAANAREKIKLEMLGFQIAAAEAEIEGARAAIEAERLADAKAEYRRLAAEIRRELEGPYTEHAKAIGEVFDRVDALKKKADALMPGAADGKGRIDAFTGYPTYFSGFVQLPRVIPGDRDFWPRPALARAG